MTVSALLSAQVGDLIPPASLTRDQAVRVTIVVPACNAATTLERAVVSALDQTERDIEIIVVDDASSDATWAVADRLRQTDPRMRVERFATNRGKSHAMNVATRMARGRWVAVLDADDWYAPDRIERLVDAAEACDVDMAADNLYFIDSHARVCTGIGFPCHGLRRLVDLDAFLEMSDPTARYDYGMLQPVFRADFLRRSGVEYDVGARVGEDFYQLLCFFQAGGRGVVLDTPLYYYVEPFGSISRRWAQPTRSRYRYEAMLETHRHFANILAPRLNARLRGLLDRRRVGIEAMIAMHQVRECIKRDEFGGAARRLAGASRHFWSVLGKKLAQRVGMSLFPQKGSPVQSDGKSQGDAASRSDAAAFHAAPPVRRPRIRVAAGTVIRPHAGRRAAPG